MMSINLLLRFNTVSISAAVIGSFSGLYFNSSMC